jgi:hypothetical protein
LFGKEAARWGFWHIGEQNAVMADEMLCLENSPYRYAAQLSDRLGGGLENVMAVFGLVLVMLLA